MTVFAYGINLDSNPESIHCTVIPSKVKLNQSMSVIKNTFKGRKYTSAKDSPMPDKQSPFLLIYSVVREVHCVGCDICIVQKTEVKS